MIAWIFGPIASLVGQFPEAIRPSMTQIIANSITGVFALIGILLGIVVIHYQHRLTKEREAVAAARTLKQKVFLEAAESLGKRMEYLIRVVDPSLSNESKFKMMEGFSASMSKVQLVARPAAIAALSALNMKALGEQLRLEGIRVKVASIKGEMDPINELVMSAMKRIIEIEDKLVTARAGNNDKLEDELIAQAESLKESMQSHVAKLLALAPQLLALQMEAIGALVKKMPDFMASTADLIVAARLELDLEPEDVEKIKGLLIADTERAVAIAQEFMGELTKSTVLPRLTELAKMAGVGKGH